jgi:hypothetical protein
MIYFVMTTISTVGYGNLLEGKYSKLLLTMLVVAGIVIVPSNCA